MSVQIISLASRLEPTLVLAASKLLLVSLTELALIICPRFAEVEAVCVISSVFKAAPLMVERELKRKLSQKPVASIRNRSSK